MLKFAATIVAFIIAGSVRAASVCSWDKPGINPTTSDPAVTLRAMGINNPRLADKIRTGDYDELVTIHKNDTRIRGMSSGNAKWCDGSVDTSHWAEGHVEHARVFSDGPDYVVWAWRCHNLMLWLPRDTTPPVSSSMFVGTGESFYVTPTIPAGPVDATPLLDAPESSPPSSVLMTDYGAPVYVPGDVISSPPGVVSVIPSPPTAPLPEPGTWAILVVGLALLASWRAFRPI